MPFYKITTNSYYSQIKNKEIDQISIDSIIQSITRKPLRVTIISALSGKVLLESQREKEPDSLADKRLDRPEIRSSLKNGNGYAIRYSQSFKKNFFYSAKRYDDWIIRSSLPFEREKFSILSPNNEFIYFMLARYRFSPYCCLIIFATAWGNPLPLSASYLNRQNRESLYTLL